MANTLLTPTIITREALRILHAKLVFLKNINRQYDKQFANSGAAPSGKIGPNLTIRMPNRYTVRTGAVMSVQDQSEESQTLTVSTQKGVDMNFPTSELTLTIDDFSKRYIEPAMTVLAANIEADALSMQKDVYNLITMAGSSTAFNDLASVDQRLTDFLCPDDDRCGVIITSQYKSLLTDMKGLFNPQGAISENFKKGKMGETLSFELYKSTLLGAFASGTAVIGDTTYQTNGPNQTGAGVIIKTGATTFKKGDVITFAGCNACHYETKADLGYLQNFVVTADYAGGGGTISISPSITTSGAKQNVTASPTDSGTVSKLGVSTSANYTNSLFFHPDAFTFVSADLVDVSKFGAWGAREVQDGISMRLARQYDITNDKIPTRIDVLYGYKTIRPELACRLQGS